MNRPEIIFGLIATIAGICGVFAVTHSHGEGHHHDEHHTHVHWHGALEHAHEHSHAPHKTHSDRDSSDDHHEAALGHGEPIEPWITPSHDVVRRAELFELLPLHYEVHTTSSTAFGCVEPPERPPRSMTSEDPLPQIRTIVLLT